MPRLPRLKDVVSLLDKGRSCNRSLIFSEMRGLIFYETSLIFYETLHAGRD